MSLSRAQIVATIGPASGHLVSVAAMIDAGMDVARINFSHGDHGTNGSYIAAIREAAAKARKRIPIIQDLAGPRMQTGADHHFDSGRAEITQKDLDDLAFGIAQNVDYIAQSYIGNAEDVQKMRSEIAARGGSIPIIAKIERREAVEGFGDILAVSDAIMIARGDLGLAVPIEDIPFIERDLVAKTKAAGKPCVTATQMLYTMTENPVPTRAEVTDVVFAILSGSDAVMLSEESARGKYPVEAVAAMEKIVSRSEREVMLPVNSL